MPHSLRAYSALLTQKGLKPPTTRRGPVTALLRRLPLSLGFGLALIAGLAANHVQGQEPSSIPSAATARCRDGTYSFSKHRSGTCSHHGGVATWLTPDARKNAPSGDTAHVVTPALPSCGGECGVERWPVKTLSDADRERIRLRDTVSTTIEALVALQRPVALSAEARADPVELTVYRVEARLLWLFTEADNDYHLVLASPQDTTITMIAEAPDPGCAGACASGFAEVYAQVRQKLLDRLNSPQSQVRPLVQITGVGFFDYIHGQRGVAPNGIELHPVLDVEFP